MSLSLEDEIRANLDAGKHLLKKLGRIDPMLVLLMPDGQRQVIQLQNFGLEGADKQKQASRMIETIHKHYGKPVRYIWLAEAWTYTTEAGQEEIVPAGDHPARKEVLVVSGQEDHRYCTGMVEIKRKGKGFHFDFGEVSIRMGFPVVDNLWGGLL